MISRADALAVLDLPPDADAADVRRVYLERAKAAHPDAGGDAAAFASLVRARDAALAAIEREPLRCLDCDGRGRITAFDGWSSSSAMCPTCRGSGGGK